MYTWPQHGAGAAADTKYRAAEADAITGRAAALDDLLTCSTCLEVMCDPVTVSPCGHSYCCACLQRWMEQSVRCPMCSVQMRHIALSYTLKAVTQRLHGPALAARRERLSIEERHAFSVAVDSGAPGLPVVGPLLMHTVEVLRAHGMPVNVPWRRFAVVWLFVFAIMFVSIQYTIGRHFEHLPYDPVEQHTKTMELIEQHFADLPMHLLNLFLAAFCCFFTLFTSLIFLRQRGVW